MAKIKICGCGEKMGTKTRTCKKCGFKFEFKKIIINGKKCPQCTELLKPRAKECNKCNYKYPIKQNKKYEEIIDWKKLKAGQTIILKSGSKGPYFQGESGRLLVGYRGKFIISKIEENAIIAYGYDRTTGSDGIAYIYMGPNFFSEKTSIYKRKYKLFKKI
jgi:hypothetical protein